MKVYVKENSLLARIAAAKLKAGKVAIVFGHTIHLYNCKRYEFLDDRDWLCHELKHVQQYREYGLAGFLVRYLTDWIKHGYYNNRFEVEARASEKDLSLLQGAEII